MLPCSMLMTCCCSCLVCCVELLLGLWSRSTDLPSRFPTLHLLRDSAKLQAPAAAGGLLLPATGSCSMLIRTGATTDGLLESNIELIPYHAPSCSSSLSKRGFLKRDYRLKQVETAKVDNYCQGCRTCQRAQLVPCWVVVTNWNNVSGDRMQAGVGEVTNISRSDSE
jgi:hypothetical protein